MKNSLYAMLGVPFVLFGITLAGDSVMRLHKADSSQGWPTVQGEVTGSDVVESRSIDGNAEFKPVLGVVYTVDGRPYESERFTFGRGVWVDKEFVTALVAPYRVGAMVRVHYNPENPADAVLQPGEHGGLASHAVTGLVFLAMGVVALIKGMRPGVVSR